MGETKHKKVREGMRDKVTELKERLQSIKEKNAKAPDLERMDCEEFVIDLDGKADIIAKNNEKANAVRKEILDDDLNVDIVASRVKKACWDSMEKQARELHGLKSARLVRSFPIRKKSDDEIDALKKVIRMRQIECR